MNALLGGLWTAAFVAAALCGWWLGTRFAGWLAERREQRRQAERQVVLAVAELRMRAVSRAAVQAMQRAAASHWE